MTKAIVLTLAAFALIGGTFRQDAPTFNRDIGPMIYRSCSPCHRPNGAAPFSLTSYEEVKKNSGLVRIQTLMQAMPPTFTHSDFGSLSKIDKLTDEELIQIQKWLRADMPVGAGPAKKYEVSQPTWSIQPTNFIRVASGLKTRAEGARYWIEYTVPVPQDVKSISAFEIRPNHPSSFQNATLAWVSSHETRSLKREVFGGLDVSGQQYIGVWAPSTSAFSLPTPFSLAIPSKARLVVQAHYQPTGKPEDAGFTIGLRKGPRSFQSVAWLQLEKPQFKIEAFDAPTFELPQTVSKDSKLVAINVEARFFASRIQLLTKPSNDAEKVVFEHYRWSPYNVGNWAPRQPIAMAKGTKLRALFSYANDETCAMNDGKRPEAVFSGPKVENEVCRMRLLFIP